ncbi:MAG: ribosome hibernation-promoting factor, HPF/YfiA family [Acidimicrobiales bacterium]
MDISIRTGDVELPGEVLAMAKEKIGHLDRFLDGMDRAEIRFSCERNPRISEREVCEVTVFGHGRVVRARAAAADPLVAVDRVLDKLEHRMEKVKGRLIGRSHPRHHPAPGPADPGRAGSRVAAAAATAAGATAADLADDDADPEDSDRIVKVKQFAIKPMTPEEAVLEMELLSHAFFFFTNSETGRAAVVYRRKDGHIGLIDST